MSQPGCPHKLEVCCLQLCLSDQETVKWQDRETFVRPCARPPVRTSRTHARASARLTDRPTAHLRPTVQLSHPPSVRLLSVRPHVRPTSVRPNATHSRTVRPTVQPAVRLWAVRPYIRPSAKPSCSSFRPTDRPPVCCSSVGPTVLPPIPLPDRPTDTRGSCPLCHLPVEK